MTITEKVYSALLIILVTLLSGGLAYGAVAAVRALVRAWASLDPQVEAGIIVGAATVLVSVIGVVVGKHLETRLLIRKEHREKKSPVYEKLIEFMFRASKDIRTGNTPPEEDFLDSMMVLSQNIMVWGSDDVLVAWVLWRQSGTDWATFKTGATDDSAHLMEKLIYAIRRDLGHGKKDLPRGAALAVLWSNIGKRKAAKGRQKDDPQSLPPAPNPG